ncbi:MAG: N-6 DNA methylase [Muribaculaceae bacterium]|nr:N-6 DNA methylase [Muribaculaceae bacterium]
MAKTKTVKEPKLEDILLDCRNSLRGSASMTEKRDLLLTLVFLKFLYEKFKHQQSVIREKYGQDEGLLNIMLNEPSSYEADGVFYLEEKTRWSELLKIDATKLSVELDNALTELNKNERLKGSVPMQVFVPINLEPRVLTDVMNNVEKIDPLKFGEKDLIGRVYEYFLREFSFQMKDNKEEGEFYTPHSIVKLIASLIEPYDGTIGDPCCGTGGMFIQSLKLIESKGGNTKSIQVYGQESNKDTLRLAKMNLVLRGISFDLGNRASSSFTDDQHIGLTVDYIMANPPFNLKKWRAEDQLTTDARWSGYDVPPASNANYAWILHILKKLDVNHGIAGFLLANGALDDADTLSIRQKLIENDKVEAIIVLPRNMFFSTDISVTLWILNNNKRGGYRNGIKLRNRQKEILFVDLRTWTENVTQKKYVELSDEQIERIFKIYKDWQSLPDGVEKYEEVELYRSVKIKEIDENGWSLVPSRYIEFHDRDTELDFDTVLRTSGEEVKRLIALQRQNTNNLVSAFKAIGYDAE